MSSGERLEIFRQDTAGSTLSTLGTIRVCQWAMGHGDRDGQHHGRNKKPVGEKLESPEWPEQEKLPKYRSVPDPSVIQAVNLQGQAPHCEGHTYYRTRKDISDPTRQITKVLISIEVVERGCWWQCACAKPRFEACDDGIAQGIDTIRAGIHDCETVTTVFMVHVTAL